MNYCSNFAARKWCKRIPPDDNRLRYVCDVL